MVRSPWRQSGWSPVGRNHATPYYLHYLLGHKMHPKFVRSVYIVCTLYTLYICIHCFHFCWFICLFVCLSVINIIEVLISWRRSSFNCSTDLCLVTQFRLHLRQPIRHTSPQSGTVPESAVEEETRPQVLNPSDVQSYRPISNLSVLSKLFGQLVTRHLDYLEASLPSEIIL